MSGKPYFCPAVQKWHKKRPNRLERSDLPLVVVCQLAEQGQQLTDSAELIQQPELQVQLQLELLQRELR